jgi:hypothetical protein
MFNTLSHKEMQIYLIPIRMAIMKETNKNAGKDVGGKGSLYIAIGNVNQCSHYGNQYGGSLKTKDRTTI